MFVTSLTILQPFNGNNDNAVVLLPTTSLSRELNFPDIVEMRAAFDFQ